MSTEAPSNGAAASATPDLMAQAVRDLKDAMDAFVRLAQFANFPAKIDTGTWAMFQAVRQEIALRSQVEFHHNMTALLVELLRRTEAGDGALDARAYTRLMAAQRVALGMGPDPDTMRELAMAAQHELANETDQHLHTTELLHAHRDAITEALAMADVPDAVRARLQAVMDPEVPMQPLGPAR
jgi:hypothetical protein